MRGVVAIVVAGSLGRGEPWPLSDIDIVPIYAEGEETDSSRELSSRAEELESAWEAEGIRTDVDVGNIWFTDREAWEAVELPPAQTIPLLGDFRWYHGIDKPYGGRAAWDPTGVARDFLGWVDRIRFAPEIVSAILARAGRECRNRWIKLHGICTKATVMRRESHFTVLATSWWFTSWRVRDCVARRSVALARRSSGP